MKVITLQGSPRKRGSTATMLGWVEDDLRAAGHEVERYDVSELRIGGCRGCGRCQMDPGELVCAVADDGLAIYQQMTQADAILYATPVYCWDFTSWLKPLIDRHLCLVTGFDAPDTHRSHIAGKRAALLATAAGPVGQGNTDTLSTIFSRLCEFTQTQPVAELIVPGCFGPSPLNQEHRELARQFAAQLTA